MSAGRELLKEFYVGFLLLLLTFLYLSHLNRMADGEHETPTRTIASIKGSEILVVAKGEVPRG